MKANHTTDIAAILAKRHDNGADYWATPDGRIYVGSPFSTLTALGILHEPRVPRSHEAVRGGLDAVLARRRCGPCHYGIGPRFMQVEYPFLRYNIFYFVYVLSHYPLAARDKRFRAAAAALATRIDADGRLVVEAPHRGLKGLAFCERGKPSDLATVRYREIVANVGALKRG